MPEPASAACPECGCVGGDECEHLNCPCWTPKNAAQTFCRHCGAPIQRSDLTMQGPRGPWIHEHPRQRLCSLMASGTLQFFAEPKDG